jgi:hypothetical protein
MAAAEAAQVQELAARALRVLVVRQAGPVVPVLAVQSVVFHFRSCRLSLCELLTQFFKFIIG